MASTPVLLFGATGYIGAAFLSRFSDKYLTSPSPRYKLTASIRSPEKARRLRDLLGNIETTDVKLDDGVKLEREVEKHNIIIQLADCDALESTKSKKKGMKTRKEKTGNPPVLYHAVIRGRKVFSDYLVAQVDSLSAFLFDEKMNGYSSHVIISDMESDLINDIPISKPHRVVDHSTVKADEAGDLLSFIIVPFAVYGVATGLIHEHKLGNQTSMPVPRLIHVSVDRRAVGQIGPGENPWMISHVNDGWSPELNSILGNDSGRVLLTILLVADLFMALIEDTTKGHGKDGFYFTDGGSVLARDVFRVMAETLYSIGLSEEPSPNTYNEEELDKSVSGAQVSKQQVTEQRVPVGILSIRSENSKVMSTVQLKRNLIFEVSLDITNTGDRDGWEVVQIYISSKESRVARPKKELEAFSKVWIRMGTSESVTFSLDKYAMSFWNEVGGEWLSYKGTYRIIVGRSADPKDEIMYRDVKLEEDFRRQPENSMKYVSEMAPALEQVQNIKT
ncbi:hypothetical protein BOTNAR_0115g00260 [Botryotinia narcissicola]|uniref:beta-glucosidase n=1 Tax=Botryotinia narcissicola TaxID=278944 RepID=A0A4Z1IL10_9HELO|nr:hypothetical protein BOTNAR_0115g00260 [Botryotinia narcissicola]